MFQTTRRRLALWYATVTAVLVLVAAIAFYGYARATLVDRVDDTIEHAIELVARSLVIESVQVRDLAAIDPQQMITRARVNLEASFRDNTGTVWNDVEDDRIDLEWFSPTGQQLWTSFAEPLTIPLHPTRKSETVKVLRDGPGKSAEGRGPVEPPLVLRQRTQAIALGGQPLGYLRVSHPWFEVTKPAQQLAIDLSLGVVALIGAVGAIGWWLSGLAMEPVRESYQRLRQFTADASHELRNPIATIQTNVQVALAETNPQMERSQLEAIERLTRRLGKLVDDLLFLARQDSGIVQPQWGMVDLSELLLEAIEEQMALATRQALELIPELSEIPDQRAWMVRGDRDQLARLLTNLIGNAIQYTPSGGRVWVRLDRDLRKPTLKLEVQDTGIGIAPEALPHLFDRFYRADVARSRHRTGQSAGSGLGLAIVQAIVQVHQGQIRLDSQLDRGTTVTITLPSLVEPPLEVGSYQNS
ncbi:HAMP domain-containing histidine kinase [Limnothrix sp. FACHB-708]|uniref:ATP-binding protein n=1 Tax=unclassified Limnothrix TaxID=2632864 RepID=UPI00168174C7|nr:HAMP domain-containing histidine kinase [Limnothrix sp. FACHB-1083]MBD2191518.1 HAMP domain-containing histidine kinase [Limnothrix sp. FACHB-1088]MBD2554077.1 HAMP domain-containing histidine kinase [Limnothrix sp. FACHB-708]MBD2591792.1 HAMP domain-containing histidine kinase [Limnothrix sp. FACHB-406]